jgi:hypothetical protein
MVSPFFAPFKSSTTIFSPKREFILVAFPFLILILVLAEISLAIKFSALGKNVLFFLANIIFLNTIHFIFTFHLAFTVPAYREVLRKNYGRLGLVALFFIGIMFIALRAIEPHLAGNFGLIVSLCTFLFAAHHGIKQSFGISLVYNNIARRENSLSQKELNLLESYERRERRYIYILLGLTALNFVLTAWLDLSSKSVIILSCVLAAATILISSHIISLYWNLGSGRFRVKSVFLTRFLLLAPTYFSVTAGIGLSAIHGMEYFYFYRRIRGHTKSESRSAPLFLKGVVALLAILVLVGAFLTPTNGGVPGLLGWDYLSENIWIRIAIITTSGLGLFHFYLDAILFAMKRPDIRSQTGHWLLTEPPTGPSSFDAAQ